jgi:hypothetical protein
VCSRTYEYRTGIPEIFPRSDVVAELSSAAGCTHRSLTILVRAAIRRSPETLRPLVNSAGTVVIAACSLPSPRQ